MNKIIIFLTLILVILTASCGMLNPPPAPQPQLSATDPVPEATAMSELPPTWTPAPTFTPTNTPPPSPTPTSTPDPNQYYIGAVMTSVAIAYPTDSVDTTGWKTFEGKTATILIPPSYEELDFAGVLMEMMFGVMEAFVEGFAELAEEIGEEMGVTPEATLEEPDLGEIPDFDFFLALEESSQSAIILASVERGPETTTESLLNEALTDQDDFQLVTREILTDAPYPMERVILDIEDPELGPGKQIIYVILGDDMAWNLMFSTPLELYDSYLPIFESVVNSFSDRE